jgi:hypothetical protein
MFPFWNVIMHLFWTRAHSEIVHYIWNRVPFGTLESILFHLGCHVGHKWYLIWNDLWDWQWE